MGFYHVGQAGLELLTSDDLLTLVSQSAGIIDMSHHVWPGLVIVYVFYKTVSSAIAKKDDLYKGLSYLIHHVLGNWYISGGFLLS